MDLLVFGNPDVEGDELAISVSEKLPAIKGLTIKIIKPNDDIPLEDNKNLYVLDTVIGIDQVTLITENDLDKFVLSPRNSAHDYDLTFQLKYLSKIGKIDKISIIGIPVSGKIDYDLIQSILRKLVAQDIQGS